MKNPSNHVLSVGIPAYASAAIQAGQLLRMLMPLTQRAGKNGSQLFSSLSRCRSLFESAIGSIKLSGEAGGEVYGRDAKSDHAFVINMANQLVDAVLRDAPLIIDLPEATQGNHIKTRRSVFKHLLPELDVIIEQGSQRKFLKTIETHASISAYSDAVRNFSHVHLLVALGASVAKAKALDEHLHAKGGSDSGRARTVRFEHLESWIPSNLLKKPAIQADSSRSRERQNEHQKDDLSSLFSVGVRFHPAALLAHPDVAPLIFGPYEIRHEPRSFDATLRLDSILSEFDRYMEVPSGQTPEEVARRSLDCFVVKLSARKSAIQAIRDEEHKKMVKANEEKAIETLRSLDPEVLRALKSNAGLLKRV